MRFRETSSAHIIYRHIYYSGYFCYAAEIAPLTALEIMELEIMGAT